MASVGVMGLDLSLRHTSAVYLSPRWRVGKWSQVPIVRAGEELKNPIPFTEVRRLDAIVNVLEAFYRKFADREFPTQVYVEDYAYGLAGRSGMKLGELGGAVKRSFFHSFGVTLIPVNISTARKFFLGKIPRGKGAAASAVHGALQRLKWPHIDSDPGDAFVIANYARTEHGLRGLAIG